MDLTDFAPDRAHLLLWEVHGDFPRHNDGTHLTGGFTNDAVWKSCWRRIAAQSASWYSTHPGKVGRRFTDAMDVEWWGILDQKWIYNIPLVLVHCGLDKDTGRPQVQGDPG